MQFNPSDRIRSHLDALRASDDSFPRQLVPVFVSLSGHRRRRQYGTCQFEGCHEPEVARGQPMIWTTGEAVVQCCLSSPALVRYFWLEIAATAPTGTRLEVWVDDFCAVRDHHVRRRGTFCFRLPYVRLMSSVNLTLRTSVFSPSEVWPGNADQRQLGIALRGIAMAKRRRRYRPGMDFRTPVTSRIATACRELVRRKRAA